MDFLEDIRRFVLDRLPCREGGRAELAAMSATDLLIVYRNWSDRLIRPTPRRVHQSHALLANPLASDPLYEPALRQIMDRFRSGGDLTPHLSARIREGYCERRGERVRNADLDLMLNDWGIHHLHLSTVIGDGGFVQRTGPLLFACVREEDAYLIDVMTHNDWTSLHVFEVMVREWPDAGLVRQIHGVLSLSGGVSEQDYKTLRGKHANALIEVDGKVYSSANGLTAAGTSISATMLADQLIDLAMSAQRHFLENPDFLRNCMRSNGVDPPDVLDLHFTIFEAGGVGVIERETGASFRLDG